MHVLLFPCQYLEELPFVLSQYVCSTLKVLADVELLTGVQAPVLYWQMDPADELQA